RDDVLLPSEHQRIQVERDVLHLALRPVFTERLELALPDGLTIDADADDLVRDASRLERLSRVDRLHPARAQDLIESFEPARGDRVVEQASEAPALRSTCGVKRLGGGIAHRDVVLMTRDALG